MKEDKSMIYVYLMKNQKPLNSDIIKSHVEHLRKLNKQCKLVLCGPFTDYPGGMVILSAKDIQEATDLATSDPFIASGCKSYELRSLEPANEENNYLL